MMKTDEFASTPRMIIRFVTPDGFNRVEADPSNTLDTLIRRVHPTGEYRVSVRNDFSEQVDRNLPVGPGGLCLENGVCVYVDYDSPRTSSSDNKIRRGRDSLLCRHSSNAMCSHCAPLDPWDQKYHKDNKIKYLSYGSYIEMLKDRGCSAPDTTYRRAECADHPRNVKCNRCDRDLRITPQIYRMVDHVEFESRWIVEEFIERRERSMRDGFGLLIGRYCTYSKVPMGVKAVVSWIYEPPQENFPDGFVLRKDGRDGEWWDRASRVAKAVKMDVVGQVFTDCGFARTDGDRNILSNLEVEMIARSQLENPYEGGSRFVTVVVKRRGNDNIVEQYMASDQCASLVKAEIILPVAEDPSVFFSNVPVEYPNVRDKHVVPVEYFVVALTHGCYKEEKPTFKSKTWVAGHGEKLRDLARYFSYCDYSEESFSNFNVMVRLSALINVKELVDAINGVVTLRRFADGKEFGELATRMQKIVERKWACKRCTFLNLGGDKECKMCGTSK